MNLLSFFGKSSFFFSFCLLFILVFSLFVYVGNSSNYPSIDQELFNLFNEEKISEGLNPVAYDIRLDRAAQLHVEDMITNNFFGHTGSDGSTYTSRAEAQGYLGVITEFLAMGSDPVQVFNMWMESPIHRQYFLMEHDHVGIGYESGYWTVVFGNGAQTPELTIEVCGFGDTFPFVGVHSFEEGSIVNVSAYPDTGFQFNHWLLNNVNVGSANPYQLTINSNHTLTAVFTVTCSLNLSAGWNMISFPAIPDDASFSSIFGDVGFYQVLTWDGASYASSSVAEAGVGYWILVLEETTVTLENAIPVTSYTKNLPAGWSMIGSICGETIDADDVFLDVYQLLTWDGTSYVTSTTIEPGKGYWALVLEPTTIKIGE